MINCSVLVLPSLFSQLQLYHLIFSEDINVFHENESVLGEKMVADILGWLKIAEDVAVEFELSSVIDRVKHIRELFVSGKIRQRDVSTQMKFLLDLFRSEFKNQLVYRYPREKAKLFYNWKSDWQVVVSNFPDAAIDVRAGVDLYCLCHFNASVYQFMRVLEHGLRELANELGLTFDLQNWQNIIEQIEAEIKNKSKNLPRGSEKIERLQYLSTLAKEFIYFKDGWRNHVSHGRAPFDERQAKILMEHVCYFMTMLANKKSSHEN